MATEEFFFPHNMATSLTKTSFVPFTLNLFGPPILPQKETPVIWVPLLLPKPEKKNKDTAQGFMGNDQILQNFINKHAVDLENVQRNKKKEKGEVTGKASSLFDVLGVGTSVGHSFRNLLFHSLKKKKKKKELCGFWFHTYMGQGALCFRKSDLDFPVEGLVTGS
jgi:hypothetical protein